MSTSHRVLVTGATGYIGRHLVQHLADNGWAVTASSRQAAAPDQSGAAIQWVQASPWQPADGSPDAHALIPPIRALMETDTVVHLAGIAHQTNGIPFEAYHRANMVASSVLGREAVQAGVRHFVFVSTIAVMGLPNNDQPLTPEMKPAPVSAYGQSKWAAEQALVNLMRNSGTRLTVIRPPLVYGPNPKGNLKQLIRLINSGLPMPWASVRNQRSMIGLSNLVHLLNHVCNLGNVEMPEPQTLMPADVCWSTPDLIRIIAKAMKRPARLFSMPQPVLNLSVRLPVIGSRCDTLLSSLVQQDQHLKEQLGWTPPETPASEIARMVDSVTVS